MSGATTDVTYCKDAYGNAVVQGEGNVVVIHYHGTSIEQVAEPAQPEFGENPYKGLAAFQEGDAERFFGREVLTAELWERFRELHAQVPGKLAPVRLLPLIGPSGSGKSSLARAGLAGC